MGSVNLLPSVWINVPRTIEMFLSACCHLCFPCHLILDEHVIIFKKYGKLTKGHSMVPEVNIPFTFLILDLFEP